MLHTFKLRFFITICVSFNFLLADTASLVANLKDQTDTKDNSVKVNSIIDAFKNQLSNNSSSVSSKGQYYCRADKKYQNYLSGMAKNLDGVKGFDTKESCEKDCVFQRTCNVLEKDIKSIKITDSKSVDLALIEQNLLNNVSALVGLELKVDGDVYTLRNDQVLGLTKLFEKSVPSELHLQRMRVKATPNTFKLSFFDDGKEQGSIQIDRSSLKSATINANYFSKDGKDYTSITTKSFNNNTKKVEEKTQIKVGKVDFYSLVGITRTNSAVTYGGFTILLSGNIDNQLGDKIIHFSGSVENKIVIANKELLFITQTEGEDLKKDTKYVIRFNGKTYNNYEIDGLIQSSKDYFTCPYNATIKGDVGDNVFSSQKACDSACSVATTCQFEDPKEPSEDDCTTEEQLLDGVGDSDGKFVYETKKIIKTCKRTRKKQVGCELYDIKTVFAANTPDLLKNMPQVETNLQNGDFSKGVAVFTKAAAAEQVAHMFSGEADYCDSGTFQDAPNWTEMGIKYGMMLLGPLISQGGFGEAYDKGYKAGQDFMKAGGGNVFDQAVGGFVHGIGSGVWNNVKSFGLEIAKNFTKEGFKTMGEQMAKNFTIFVISKDIQLITQAIADAKNDENQVAINNIAFISDGASAGADKKNIKTYEELGGAHDEDDLKAADYAKCMTNKFRLYPADIMNYSLGINPDDLDDKEEQDRLANFYFPSKASVQIEWKDLYLLNKVMENKKPDTFQEKNAYFNAHYSVKQDGNKVLLKSLSPDDYMIAAETICGGPDTVGWIQKKYGKRFMNPDLQKKPTAENLQAKFDKSKEMAIPNSGNTNDSDKEKPVDIANQLLDMSLQTLNPPFNMLASIVLDYVKTFSRGNTCTDEDFAKERKEKDSKNGDMYVKTNKRLASGLCFKTGEDPKFQVPFPWLPRKREYFCCYDQKLTMIFAQGIMDQLGRGLNGDSCSNITPNDLDKISFTECEKGQDPQKDKCFPRDRFNELSQTILQGGSIGSDDLLKNIIKSTLQLKEKLDDPDPIDQKDIIDTSNQSEGGN